MPGSEIFMPTPTATTISTMLPVTTGGKKRRSRPATGATAADGAGHGDRAADHPEGVLGRPVAAAAATGASIGVTAVKVAPIVNGSSWRPMPRGLAPRWRRP
jgi:hypothetical protein